MSDTDVPPPGWGVIDRSALTSRMPIRPTTVSFDDKTLRPLRGFRPDLADEGQMLDPAILGEFQQTITQHAAQAREALDTLLLVALLSGDPRGVEYSSEMDFDGDHATYRTRYRLSDDVPAGEIRFKVTGES